MTKALFLDRDGIINEDHGYVYKIEDFQFVDGVFDLCHHAIELGYDIFVITNQAGIARGYYQVEDFEKLTKWMLEQFKEQDIVIRHVYFCPHHPTKGVNDYKQECDCRKPKPGMLFQAKKDYGIDLKQSIFIGDKTSDIQAAEAAGIHNRIFVQGKYKDHAKVDAHRVNSLLKAVKYFD